MLTGNLGSVLAAKFGTIQQYTSGGQIWRGATVALRLALADDFVYPAVDDATDTYQQLVVGFAMEAATAGKAVRVRRDGKLKRKLPNIPSSIIGRLACVKDDESVQLYSANTCKVVVGRIVEKASSTEVYVDITDRPARLATSLTD